MKQTKATHVSTTVEVKEMLKAIAEAEDRKMRTVLERLITQEYNKVVGNGKSRK